ncbi:hypothetical protein HYPSUDRAFT_152090 [Hypholoma sublateritium FD-334 SS-4]|uniref:hAT-like transposase RNase-H fold domain-containing protein n=1 Tax=Hypholoma sublateritium (strain FD-334 SS-4) TaxID=945553 RepID=A0A0D2LQ99_HYPSF|nr:hypothetical protein HYPSUDRAFT_152090 [Hypholoma sublateritium FD-334 SS-4]
MEAHNKSQGVQLRRFRLTEEEWDLLREISPLLDIFLYATKKISARRIPLIQDVIPYIDIITNDLVSDFIDNNFVSLVVRHAAHRGYLMLNKYYSLTDDSSVYRIAMILHPKYKTKYFVDAGWEHLWIQVAEELVCSEWRANYKKVGPSEAERQHVSSQQESSRSNMVFII